MKSYIIFLASFIILFSLSQIVSGLILTALYKPDMHGAWKMCAHLPQEVMFGDSSGISTLIAAVLSAAIAYLIPNAVKRFSKTG